MKYTSEDDVKKALGIDTWRNVSKEAVMKFAAILPDVDKEVALKIIEKVPEFTAFALETVNTVERAHATAHADNMQSMAQVHEACSEARQILKGQLDEQDLPLEERRRISDMVMETVHIESSKDTENKEFVKDVYKIMAGVACGALLMMAVYVGGKVGVELPAGGWKSA